MAKGPKLADVLAFVQLWNDTTAHTLPRCTQVNASRQGRIKACLREEPSLESWCLAMRALCRSSFHRGHNDRGWKARIDYLIQPKQRASWLESGQEMIEQLRQDAWLRRKRAEEAEAAMARQAQLRRSELTDRVECAGIDCTKMVAVAHDEVDDGNTMCFGCYLKQRKA